MSHTDYKISETILSLSPTFSSLLLAASHLANQDQLSKLMSVFPSLCEESENRFKYPSGYLPSEARFLPDNSPIKNYFKVRNLF